MSGRATFRLWKGQKENNQNIGSETYEVLHCDYAFNKGITREGEVRTDLLGGEINLSLPVFPTSGLLSWVFDGYKKYDGEISLHSDAESLGKLYFEQGRCISFRMHYDSATGSPHPVTLLLTINAQRIVVGHLEYRNRFK